MRRFLFAILIAATPVVASAQARITPEGCVSPGDTFTVSMQNIPPTQDGEVVLRDRSQTLDVNIVNWRRGQFRAQAPRRGLDAGDVYTVTWSPAGSGGIDLGRIEICSEASAAIPGRQPRASKDVVPTQEGAPEYAVIVPNAQVNAATGAIEDIGGTVLRSRSLPQFGQTILLVGLSGGADLQDLRDALEEPAPGAEADFHHVYGLAQGARLYAAAMVGAANNGCNIRSGTRIGLIDSGVNAGHPALSGVPVRGFDALASGERRLKPDHGTAVAVLLAGRSADLSGFAQGASLYAAEAFGVSENRSGARLENIAASLDWMASQRVKYVNLSMSGTPNRAFERLLRLSAGKGAVLIAAAGNEGTSKPRYPAASSSTIAVTAVDAKGKPFRKANSGKHIDVAAPGVDLFVAGSSGASYKSGTSYASPIALARLAAAGVGSKDQAVSFLAKNVTDLGPAGKDTKFGFGLVTFSNCF